MLAPANIARWLEWAVEPMNKALRVAIALGGAIFMLYASYALVTLAVTGIGHTFIGALGGVCFLVACVGVGIALDVLSRGANE